MVHQAALLEHIVTDQRYYSEYFRVAFYGNFPAALRDKQFIVSWVRVMRSCSSCLVSGLRVGKVWGVLRAHVEQGGLLLIVVDCSNASF